MKQRIIIGAILIGMFALGQSIGLASLKEAGKDVLAENFEDGKLADWEIKADFAKVEIFDGNSHLALGDYDLFDQMVWLKGRKFKDFVIEARVKKIDSGGADRPKMGFVFRGGCKAGFAMIGSVGVELPGKERVRGMENAFDLMKFTTLKLVCAGSVATVYVNGQFECQVTNLPVTEGPIGLYAANRRCWFDDVKISTLVDPAAYLVTEAQSPDDCLVFVPGKNVKLSLKVSNYADGKKTTSLTVSVQKWTGEEVNPPVKSEELTLNGQEQKTIVLDLGIIPEGYYKMVVLPSQTVFPLAVQERGTSQAGPPDIPIGAYWYYKHWELTPIWKNTYCHTAGNDLKKHNFNAIVTFVGMPADQLDILRQYGVYAMTRGGDLMDHPAVIGTLEGDEPNEKDIPKLKEAYRAIRAKGKGAEKPISTCMVGDGEWGGAQEAWKELAPIGGVRMFRWYGIKKEYYDILRFMEYKHSPSFTDDLILDDIIDSGRFLEYNTEYNNPSFIDILRQARSDKLTPYWIILPSFGSGKGAEAYFSFPAPNVTRAMMHLAMAYDAKGILFWSYQNAFGPYISFVEPLSLLPIDDRYAEAGEAAGMILRQAALLKSLKNSPGVVWCDDYDIEPVCQTDGTNTYVYVVNKSPKRTIDFRLFHLNPTATLLDLYENRKIDVKVEEVELALGTKYRSGVARMSLAPGDGRLLRISRPATASAVSRKVEYPAWVQGVPEQNVKYLMDLEASNIPRPGWIPGNEKSISKKPWKGLNKDQILYASKDDPGYKYSKSLYAHAETTIEYDLPAGYTHFVAAAGFGNPAGVGNAVAFRVLVDGVEKFNSGAYKLGPLLPVVVDIAGAKKLTLITGCGDGATQNDYVWWGEARLIKK